MGSPRLIDWHKVMRLELAKAELSTPEDAKVPKINLYFSGTLTVSERVPSDDDPAEPERARVVSYLNPVDTRVLGVSLDHLSSLDQTRNAIGGTLRRDFPTIILDEEGRQVLMQYVWDNALENVRSITSRHTADLSLYVCVDVEIQRLFSDDDVDCSGMVPALESAVEALERVSSEKVMEMGCCCCCAICLEKYLGDCEVVSMPCCHVFHGSCIREWLKVNHCCPMCRFQLPTTTTTY